ncbi:ABC transporter permease [Pseudomonas piscis]|uniref:ABC transporter permease n=1 Tax=Pseudomonas piscis TaxID=2614538 RepID=UPI0021D5E79C|nr:ABC transporter permease [Pseudomonas piscis]MCU7650481.1 ABC transporter permease [Pseudomonas piscis]
MTRLALVFGNLRRSGMRTALLMLSIGIALLLFGLLAAFERAFSASGAVGDQGRMVVVNKLSFTQPLPLAHFDRLHDLKGVAAATHATWFGGYYREPRNTLHAMAVEPQTFLQVYRDDIRLADDQRQAFLEQRASVIVGSTLAERWGWRVGDRIPVFSNRIVKHDGSRTWELLVAGIFQAANAQVNANFLYLHHDYLDQARSTGVGTIGFIIFEPQRGVAGDELGQRVDRLFDTAAVRTTTDSEKSFNRAFIQQFGDMALMARLVAAASLASLLLVLGNAMLMAVHERTREIGVLKALGFGRLEILVLVLAEVLGLALAGGLVGLTAASVAVWLAAGSLMQIAPGMSLGWQIWGLGIGIILALALLAGLVPAVSAMRVRIVDALGRY